MTVIINHISKISLFHELSIDHRKDLASLLVDKAFKRGPLVFPEGDDGTGFYVIISDRVKIL